MSSHGWRIRNGNLLEEAIDTLFRDRQKDDLVLLYFSGHGIKDETGKFSLATRLTEKHRLRTTAVAASFVHDVMFSSRSRRQVVILDCCFSGAFATGMMAKDDASVDVKARGYRDRWVRLWGW